MKNTKGFTLLELLIAATIIGILAVYATISYRNSEAETRIAAAKARTEVLAGAVQRFRLEYETGAAFSGEMDDVSNPGAACSISATTPDKLITCHFVENGGWNDDMVSFYVCNGKTGNCASSPVAAPLACMQGKNHSHLPNQYKTGYLYCVSAVSRGEVLGS